MPVHRLLIHSMQPMRHKVLFIFLDGFGLGTAGEHNPLYASHPSFLTGLLCADVIQGTICSRNGLMFRPLDVCLGVEGLPQSATGQTALFTGINAAQALGCHLPAFPNPRLREIIAREALLKKVTALGLRATFANAYTPGYFEMVQEGKRMHSVTTLSVFAAGVPFRMVDNLADGDAVYWDVTRERFPPGLHTGIERITPELAGKHLAAIADRHELTVYECFLPDLIGHKRDHDGAVSCVEMLDRFLGSVAKSKHDDVTLLVCSDHGNIEDLSVGVHTTNPVPLLAYGPAAPHFAGTKSILDVAPAILGSLQH